jgi:hypothetical protein
MFAEIILLIFGYMDEYFEYVDPPFSHITTPEHHTQQDNKLPS